MNSFKFRAWDGKEFYEPILYQGRAYRDFRDFEDGIECSDPVAPYLGHNDRNGVEIYGDSVVKSLFNGQSYPITYGTCPLYDEGGGEAGVFDGYIWDYTPFSRDAYGNTDHYEVVGHIHDGKEYGE